MKPKKHGQTQLSIDPTGLNAVPKSDTCPMPQVGDFIDSELGHKPLCQAKVCLCSLLSLKHEVTLPLLSPALGVTQEEAAVAKVTPEQTNLIHTGGS